MSQKEGSPTMLAAAIAQTRPSNNVPVAGLGGYQMGGKTNSS